jgi:ABC-type amino acid transport system permease subunit
MNDRTNSWENVIKWVVIGILAIVAVKVALTVVGIAIGLVFGLGAVLWKLLPWVLAVWVVLKIVEWLREKNCGTSSPPAGPTY